MIHCGHLIKNGNLIVSIECVESRRLIRLVRIKGWIGLRRLFFVFEGPKKKFWCMSSRFLSKGSTNSIHFCLLSIFFYVLDENKFMDAALRQFVELKIYDRLSPLVENHVVTT